MLRTLPGVVELSSWLTNGPLKPIAFPISARVYPSVRNRFIRSRSSFFKGPFFPSWNRRSYSILLSLVGIQDTNTYNNPTTLSRNRGRSRNTFGVSYYHQAANLGPRRRACDLGGARPRKSPGKRR